MQDFSFSVFPNENFMDLRLFQYGWEQCAPLHSFGPFVRNHFLFHYVISGKGRLDSNGPDGVTRHYALEANQGFLICPGQVNTYYADKHDPWKYVWLEFGGLRAEEHLSAAGLGEAQPIYQPKSPALAEPVRDTMLYIADHPKTSIGDIAASCGYPNQLHFSRAFKKRYGVSPREWRIQNKIRAGS